MNVRGRSTFRVREIAGAIKVAKTAGAERVEIDTSGRIVIILGEAASLGRVPGALAPAAGRPPDRASVRRSGGRSAPKPARSDGPTKKNKLQFVQEYADRHGKMRRYFRRAGFRLIALKAKPGSPEFAAEYAAAMDQTRQKAGAVPSVS
jgi:hypothetical protein